MLQLQSGTHTITVADGDILDRNLLKQAVAALLNTATETMQYLLTTQAVIDAVTQALVSGRSAQKRLADLLDEADNGAFCNTPAQFAP